jgi:predicted AlkP superfamily phosphohydrolase/phosphomutase
MMKTTPNRSFVLLCALGLSLGACRSGTPPAGTAPPRVVMVSYDGVGADLAWGWLADGILNNPAGVSGMVAKGTAARRVRMVDPTLTAVNHIALVTGALPQTTGIVSNYFHPAGSPITRGISGFSAPIGAETLWQAARRRGKRVGILTWPGADGTSPARSGDFGLTWPERPLAGSAIDELDPSRAGSASVLPSNDGLPALVWPVSVKLPGSNPGVVTFTLTAVDGDPNGLAVYDTVAVQGPATEEVQLLGRDHWFALSFAARGQGDDQVFTYGAWCKVLRLDRERGGVRLYVGAVNRTYAYPEAFAQRLGNAVGPWPGAPDSRLLSQWWLDMGKGIDLDTYLEQAERLDRWLDAVAGEVISHERFDLLLAYHPTPDDYEHASLIIDKRQWAWSPGSELAAREGLKRIGRSFDRSVATLWGFLNPGRDTLVVVSDHGLDPLHDEVKINQALAAAGLVTTVDHNGRLRPAADTPILAYTSGGCAHVYLNLEGREPDGVVKPEAAPDLLRRAARALADLSAGGEPVVERIFTRAQAARIGLDSPQSGDLIVFLRPGYAASAALGGKAIEPTRYYGQHGYLASHDELCGIFFARGPDVAHKSLKEIPAAEIAPMVARWSGIGSLAGEHAKVR